MTQIVFCVITNSGDGSNSLHWCTCEKVVDEMEKRADEGDECYASGDGLQVKEFYFPDDFDLTGWLSMNHINLTTMSDMEDEYF